MIKRLISILVFDYHLQPDQVENMSIERLITYIKMAIDLNKERSP